jgi:hypothetical protein
MSATEMILIALVAILLLAVVGLYMRMRSSRALQSRFGPEYTRAVVDRGDADKAEAHLRERERRVRSYRLKLLSRQDRQRFADEWRQIQARFVDDPMDAAARADALVGQVMTARGYPEGDFDQRLEDLSVDHPMTVQNYRAGRQMLERRERGEASTEDMRMALIHLRALFDELVGEPHVQPARAAS